MRSANRGEWSPLDFVDERIEKLEARVTELEATFKHHGIPLAGEDIAQIQAWLRRQDKPVTLEIDPTSVGLKKP